VAHLPVGFGFVRSCDVDAKGQARLHIDLQDSVARMLSGPSGRIVRGLPPCLVSAKVEVAEGVVKGALLASPLRPYAHGWKVDCPTRERAMALVGLLRRCGVTGRQSASDRSPTVKISAAELRALERLGVEVPAVVQEIRTMDTTGQEILDAINARRRAHQENRTRRALDFLGDRCPPSLRRAGELRVSHPDLSLEALGKMMDPPATRHAVCGQLRRLHEMATHAEGP
jgi:hypothetical protein